MNETSYLCRKCDNTYTVDELVNSKCPVCHESVYEDSGIEGTVKAAKTRNAARETMDGEIDDSRPSQG